MYLLVFKHFFIFTRSRFSVLSNEAQAQFSSEFWPLN